jgi:hypothetical protein
MEKKVMELTAVANKGKICNTYGIFGIRPFATVSFGLETFAMANRKLLTCARNDAMDQLIL